MSRACIGSDERTDGWMAGGAGAEKKGTDKLAVVAGPDGQLLEDELGSYGVWPEKELGGRAKREG